MPKQPTVTLNGDRGRFGRSFQQLVTAIVAAMAHLDTFDLARHLCGVPRSVVIPAKNFFLRVVFLPTRNIPSLPSKLVFSTTRYRGRQNVKLADGKVAWSSFVTKDG